MDASPHVPAPAPVPAPVPAPGDTPSRTATPAGRALVLGGGGSTGNAWLIGVLAGLLDAGLDVTGPDLTVGTSAGSTAAAQVAGAAPTDLLAAVLATAPEPPPRARPGGPGFAGTGPVASHLERIRGIIASSVDAADMRRRMGAAALELAARSDGSWQAQWRATVAARLLGQHWPPWALAITAVDAGTGEPVTFDRSSGVDLVDAVAASCAGGLPYRIGDRPYVDGGYRRSENADLAAGCSRVLVLSPLGGRTLHPLDWGMQLSSQVEELRSLGSAVETVVPDAGVEHLFGARAMDVSLRPAAARAGHEQGTRLATRLRDFWD